MPCLTDLVGQDEQTGRRTRGGTNGHRAVPLPQIAAIGAPDPMVSPATSTSNAPATAGSRP